MIPKVLRVRGPRWISGCIAPPIIHLDPAPRGGTRASRRLEVAHRIDGRAVDTHFEVNVRPEAVTGAAGGADHLTLPHRLAHVHADRALVPVAGRDAPAVVDARVVP